MKKMTVAACGILAAFAAIATECDLKVAEAQFALGKTFQIWPEGRVPLQKSTAPRTVCHTTGGSTRVTDINFPELSFFSAGEGVRPALIICPGGGYHHVTYGHEGVDIAVWLNSLGYSAFVLKFRVPGQREAALMDIQRSVSLVRSRAAEFGVDAKKIGVIGFSAGAHLTAKASTNWRRRAYDPVDAADEVSCRPDFALPIYPWELVVGDNKEKTLPLMLRGEFPVDAETPSTYICQAEDDYAHVENALAYYAALKYAGVRAEMHLYPDGGHGFGLQQQGAATDGWHKTAERWLAREVPVK